MSKVVIVGGGFSGLLAAKHVDALGVDWVGLERTEKLGGRLMSSVPRVRAEQSKLKLESLFPESRWEWVNEQPLEAKKGSWVPLEEEPEAVEAYLKGCEFFQPAQLSESWLLQGISDSVKGKFHLDKAVGRIVPEERKIWCTDGSEYRYDQALWCAPLSDFFKACPSAAPQWKIPKNRSEFGCVVLEMRFSEPLASSRNALSLSFRFGDGKVKAVGNPILLEQGQQAIFWNIYLEEGLAENKEEVAHCLRNFKRELSRQFPQVSSTMMGERIVYLPRIVLDKPLEGESFELANGFYYLGSEARLAQTEKLEHLDLLLENADFLFSQAPWKTEMHK